MFWKKKKPDASKESKIILAMVMLADEKPFDIHSFVTDYKNHYPEKIEEPTGDNTSFVFTIAGNMVAIVHMPVPIPSGDIEGTAHYAYNWQNALEETAKHKGHLLVSIMRGPSDPIKRFRLLTQVLSALLRITNSIGIYEGSQSLLIPKADYLNEAALMTIENLPLNLWIYFGLRVSNKGNSGYTYGLKAFNKKEMEVLNSSRNLEEIRGFLFNIAHYVLDNNVTFRDGETVGGSEEEKIRITLSKGQLVEGDSFKISF